MIILAALAVAVGGTILLCFSFGMLDLAIPACFAVLFMGTIISAYLYNIFPEIVKIRKALEKIEAMGTLPPACEEEKSEVPPGETTDEPSL